MIFVTVGTHEQQFNRLIEKIDELKADDILVEEVVIQTGFSTYKPKHCTCHQWIPYQDMKQYVEQARIIITHGGPSSFIMSLQVGKIPIVVPRKKKFGEHVNDHQVSFSKMVAEHQKNIIVVEDIKQLKENIVNHRRISKERQIETESNNDRFNGKLEEIVREIFYD